MDTITLKLLLIFTPGLIGMAIYNHLVCKSKQSFKYFIVYSILFGIISYSSVNILISVVNFILNLLHKESLMTFDFCYFFNVIKKADSTFVLELAQFWLTCCNAVFIALFLTLFINKCWFYKIINFLKISNRDSTVQVWNRIFGDASNDNWVLVLDFKNNRIYDGRLYHYSDYSDENEMFLKGVIIYDLTTKQELERCNGLYISRANKEATLIIPKADAQNDFLNRECYYFEENKHTDKNGGILSWIKNKLRV